VFQALPFLLLLAQAEPAPAPPVPAAPVPAPAPAPPPAAEPAEPLLGWALGLTVGGAYRLPPAGEAVPPGFGFSFSTFVGWRYARLAPVDLALQATFGYHRFSRTVPLTKMVAPGQEQAYDGTRALSMGDFTLLQTATLDLGRVRPWFGVGGGISLDHFSSAEPRFEPGEASQTVPILQVGVGLHLEVAPQTDGGLQLDYVHSFGSDFVTTRGERLDLFGDRLAVRLEMQYRF
jgi:hypothetical protein